MGPPLSLIGTCTISDGGSDQPQLVRCFLRHLLHPLTHLRIPSMHCTSIDVHACCMPYVHEWNGRAVISPLPFSRGCSQTLSLSIDLFTHLVHPLVLKLLSSGCSWSFSPNSHALSHLFSHLKGSDWSEYMVWKSQILWGDPTKFCAEYHFRLSL